MFNLAAPLVTGVVAVGLAEILAMHRRPSPKEEERREQEVTAEPLPIGIGKLWFTRGALDLVPCEVLP